MNLLRPIFVFASLCVVTGPIRAQNPPAATQPEPAKPNPGVTPMAPPPISTAVVIPWQCFELSNQTISANNPAGLNRGNPFPATAQLQVTLTSAPGSGAWTVRCGSPTYPGVQSQVNGADMAQTKVTVWTADDSKGQLAFVRAEVKSAIEQAVEEKIVKSAVVQDAAAKAIEDQSALQNAIQQALPDAIDKAIEDKLGQIEDDIKKLVLEQLKKDQGKTVPPQTHQ